MSETGKLNFFRTKLNKPVGLYLTECILLVNVQYL